MSTTDHILQNTFLDHCADMIKITSNYSNYIKACHVPYNSSPQASWILLKRERCQKKDGVNCAVSSHIPVIPKKHLD